MLTNIFQRNINVVRKGDGEYVNGIWQDGANINFVIRASVHPTPAEVLETLPEGYRTTGSYTLYTTTELVSAEIEKNNPDTVSLYNHNYLVAKIKRWENTFLSHYEVVIVKDERDVD